MHMASPISTSTGLGSGLDITSIVSALVDADKSAKQTQITTQTTKTTASLSGVSQLKSALEAFQKTLTTLNSTTTPAFLGFSATSSNESAVKATANNSAVSGSYTVVVNQLATSSKVATASISAAQASAIPSGELTITQNGITSTVKIEATSTLEQVRDAINTQMQAKGVSANIINDSNGSRLVFSSTTTGADSDISVSGSPNGLLDIDGTQLMSATASGAGAITGLAQDAEFTVDGLPLTSSKNTVDNAVSGLSLTLVAKGLTSTVTVATNTDGLKTSMQSFVDSYNTLVKLVTTLTKGSTATDGTYTAAGLTGDSTPRNILAAIRKEIATSVSTSGLGSLSQLGITTQQADGTLLLDSTKFTAAVADKQFGNQIQNLLTGDTGLLKRIEKSITPFTAADGVLAQKTTSLGKIQTRLTSDQDALDRRVATLTATLTAKYNAMDLIVGQLKATASSITSIFEAMNAQANAS
jgi:flagellar hook-associated protein 2